MDTPNLINFTQTLIQTQSFSGQEGPVAQVILEELQNLGFDRAWIDPNGSVIGVIDGAQPGPTILLDSHSDTVGVVNPEKWTRDPFGGEIADGYVYGRGTADMKGALAAMIYGAAAADKTKIAGHIAVSATVLEELLEGVSLEPVMEAVQPDFVVIGEATELNLNRGGRGRAEIHIETIGKPSHSSTPHLGINAIHLMMAAIPAVEKIPLPAHPLMGNALLALTDIISDPYPGFSVIPGRCHATFDRRLLPGETRLGVLESIETALPNSANAIIASGEYVTYTGAQLTGEKFFPAWELDENHPLVQRSLNGLLSIGLHPKIGAYRFCTNAAYSAGLAGVPTIGFGPGAEGDAHVVDERLSLDALQAARRGYTAIIEAVLGN